MTALALGAAVGVILALVMTGVLAVPAPPKRQEPVQGGALDPAAFLNADDRRWVNDMLTRADLRPPFRGVR